MFRRLLVSIVLVIAGLVGGMVITGRMFVADESRAAEPQAREQPREQPRTSTPAAPAAPAPVGGPDFTRVAGTAVKGVANISSLQVVRRQASPLDDPFFRYFFGDQDMFGPRDRRSLSLGSGVVVSPDGFVVTNNHVVGENVREITVALEDKRAITGRESGIDPATDIALLKIDVRNLPIVPWRDSSRLQVGEW